MFTDRATDLRADEVVPYILTDERLWARDVFTSVPRVAVTFHGARDGGLTPLAAVAARRQRQELAVQSDVIQAACWIRLKIKMIPDIHLQYIKENYTIRYTDRDLLIKIFLR